MSETDQRDTAIKNAVSQIEKQFGKGAIMKLGSRDAIDVPAISTGCLSLDIITGVGGFPRGRVIEVYGPEASGKTTVALHAINIIEYKPERGIIRAIRHAAHRAVGSVDE